MIRFMRQTHRTPVRSRTTAVAGWAAVAMLVAIPARPAGAQGSGDGFLFQAPRVSLTLRGGYDRALAGSDLFSFTTDQLTVSRGDFSGGAVGADLAIRVLPQLDVVLGASYTGSTSRSEFRHFVDQNDLPIEQSTVFRRVPITASVKGYLLPRGRSVGRLAWIPSRFAPFVGAGGGVMKYRFSQEGDFVDFDTKAVFFDRFVSTDWTPTAHAFAGVDYSLSSRFALTGETRYTWARGDVGQDFSGFKPIDLSGVSATAGLTVRF